MTDTHMDFLPPDRQLFRPLDSLGEALRRIAQMVAPQHTAKSVARRWGLDPSTGENVTKGNASGSTVIKAVKAEGEDAWALWDALGELIIGESRDTYDERLAARLQERADHARSRLQARRVRTAELEARASAVGAMAHRERSLRTTSTEGRPRRRQG